jgi:glycosyltransferase involved in cell wall biosynthesis
MRFLILTQYFAPEICATSIRLAAVARELGLLGHEVEVVTAMPNHPRGRIFPEYAGAWRRDDMWEGIPVHRVRMYASTGAGLARALGYASFSLAALGGLWKARRPDFVFVESPPPTVAIPGVLAAALWKTRLILNVADLWPDSISALNLTKSGVTLSLLRMLERWMYRKADYVNAITAGVRRTLESGKGVEPERILDLPNGVDLKVFHPMAPDLQLKNKLGLPENVLLYAGTIGYAHALDTVIDAAELFSSRPDIHFLFVGDGSEKRRLQALAVQKGLRNVTFHPPVPAEELPRYASLAKAAIVSQRDVPLFAGNRPAKLFAMMGCGKPLVFCGDGEGARLVEQARSGIAVRPEDPRALARAIDDLLSDDSALAEFGRQGRRFVEARYGWSRLVRDWAAELQSRTVPDLSEAVNECCK